MKLTGERDVEVTLTSPVAARYASATRISDRLSASR